MPVRTSASHPLRIDEVLCNPFALGTIGVTFCTGKCSSSLHGDRWERDLDLDLTAVSDWGATVMLTLLEQHELTALGVPHLGDLASKLLEWHHLPIVDVEVPGKPFESAWPAAGTSALKALRSGEKVLVHCKGGLGRAGTVASCLLVELGALPSEALHRVRRARPGAVETASQERFVLRYAPRLRS